MKRLIFTLLFLFLMINSYSQTTLEESKLSFYGDFRFRIEQDWSSKKADGSFRDDRSRLRYRVRLGLNYLVNQSTSMGVQIRTGEPNKQQDPQLTLGDAYKEFGTLPVGFEKIFFQTNFKGFFTWIGKNTFPFDKNNELFWSDNVYPEGIFLKKSIATKSNFIFPIDISGGHFIIGSSGKSFNKDSYMEGFQLSSILFNDRLKLFPSFYLFKNIPNIPDGGDTFAMDYTIFHLGSQLKLYKSPLINLEMDFYSNLKDNNGVTGIPSNLVKEKNGLVGGISYGQLKTNGDWAFKFTYSYLEQYAAVDFLAQNDWARWDYSSFGSPDGRLTNFKGVELVSEYMLNKSMKLKVKYYLVEQIVPYGDFKETGNRIRLDFDFKF
ncbi:putative porin [Mariniflexile litorale]|uniref:Porin n=1 Tax=Mariniflexile litorale TaxID=3045158 RepID=A0AAU7ECC0_9FLAO|nr:putative porin [Mariniflexile sp. KMM 9835]MDQ8213071.1 putative porin [Mariniflexile sp. KMM 9835]